MTKKLKLFFERSIGNKLMVGLPMTVALVLIFSFALSVLSLRQLLTQTITLVVIGFVAIAACTIIVAALGHLISDPVRKLAEEACQMAGQGSSFKPLSLAGRRDEVGILASRINNLMEKLGQQEKELIANKLHAATGNLATQIAHDIRSPLSSLQAAVRYMGELQTKDPRYSDYLNLLALSSKRLSEIANELLEGRGRTNGKKKWLSIHHILDELLGEYEEQRGFDGVEIQRNYHHEALYVIGDRVRLTRAFGNLIKNAIEAIGIKGFLKVSTTVYDPYVEVSIEDSGRGFSKEKLELITKGGFTEGKQEGHGIGLTVVQEVIKEHGGTLETTSKLGKGTKFVIKLPVPASETLSGEVFETEHPREVVLGFYNHEPVVVIEDDAPMREHWRVVLERAQRNALLCENWEEFEKRGINSKITRNAIVDQHFRNSQVSGVEAIRRIKRRGWKQIYLCTAEYWKPDVKEKARDLGVELCPKPLPKIIVKTIGKIVDHGPLTINRAQGGLIAGKPRANGYKVIVIDDDDSIRISWQVIQEKLGIAELKLFRSLKELIASGVEPSGFDLAFVDKNLDKSEHSGADVVNYLKEKELPRVALASGEDAQLLKKDPNYAKVDFFLKEKIPLSLDELLASGGTHG